MLVTVNKTGVSPLTKKTTTSNVAIIRVYRYPVKYLDPDGEASLGALLLIADKADIIKSAADKYGVDPIGIAMILYQENYHGQFFVNMKDLIGLLRYDKKTYVDDSTHSTFSADIGQIQLRRGAELLEININQPGAKAKIYGILMDENMAIDLIAANIKFEEKNLGRKINGEESGFVHNMGAAGYKRYLSGANLYCLC
jgi:hypothetical protein